MDKKIKHRKSGIELSILVVVIGLINLVGYFFPPVSLVNVLMPLAFSIYAYRNKLAYALAAVVASTLVLGLLSMDLALATLVYYGPLGIFIGYAFNQSWTFEVKLVGALGIGLVGLGLWYLGFSQLVGIDLLTFIKEEIQMMTPDMAQVNNLVGGNVADVDDMMSLVKESMLALLPYFTLVALFIHVYVSMALSRWLLIKLKASLAPWLPLSQVRLPEHVIMGATLIMVLAFVSGQVLPGIGDVLMYNVFQIVIFIYALQGLAVLSHTLKKTKIGQIGQVLLMVIAVFVFQFIGLSILGFIDMVFDIRKLKQSKEGSS